MTTTDVAPSSKTPRRWGLFAPYILLAAAILAWSAFWLVMRSQVETGLIRQAAQLRAAGYEVSWKTLGVGGYPFRIEIELTGARLAEPKGWGLAAPRLQAEANAYALNHWVFVAPQGLSLNRPGKGAVTIQGEAIRASIADIDSTPRVAFQGDKLTFAASPEPGSEPFPFTAIDRVDFHLRPAPGDKVQFQLGLTGAQTRRAGVFARIAPLAPMSLTLQSELSRVSGFAGHDWSDDVRAWTAQGGQAEVHQLQVSVGDLSLEAHGGPLTVAADGWLQGGLALSLRQGTPALAILGAAQGLGSTTATPTGGLRLDFADGQTTLGPIRIGPAPRVF